MRSEVERAVPVPGGVFRSLGLGRQRVHLELRADGEALAAQLHPRFGEALAITVGVRPYPPAANRGGAPEGTHPAARRPVMLTLGPAR